MSEFQKVATTEELGENGQKTVLIEGIPALIIKTDDGNFYAIEDTCSHATKPLAGGEVKGHEIECPFHGAKFDITTGEALCLPASQPIEVFEVDVRWNEIFARKKSDEQPEESPSMELEIADSSAGEKQDSSESTESGPAELDAEPGLLEALKEVVDPELMVNIVDLGLIYEISQEEGLVKVDMTLTSPACPVGPQLVQQSKMALEKLPSVTEAEINLVMSPPWSPERMTDDARDQLGIF